MKKKITLLFALILAGFFGQAQTTLGAGDIAIVLINQTDNTLNSAASNDNISFVLLKDITSGTKIYFTDFGWRSDAAAFQTAVPCGASTGAVTDGIVEWTATSALTYGTVVHMNVKITPTVNIGTITGYQAIYNPSNPTQYVSIASTSEAVFAYQGSSSSPTLITGVNTKNAWATSLLNCDFNPTASTLPSALTTGSSALSWSTTSANGILNSSVTLTGNKTTDLANIYNPVNWTYSSTPFAITSVIISPPATLPTVSTQAAGSILATTATGNGNITALGDPTPTQYGVVWSESANPTVALSTKTTQGVPGGTGAFTSSITGLSPNTTYHVRAYATNTAGTAYGDDVTFTTLTNGTFTGTASNDWGTSGNWAGGSVPTAGTDVIIPTGKTTEIAPGTSANCNNITIDPAGSLTIKSDATNAGSLIVAGSATGNVTYESYLAETGKWHVVAAPVASQNIWDFATLAGNSIAEKTGKRAATEYNESSNTWDTNYPTADTEGSFSPGTGYTVLRSAAGVVSYNGTINTSDVSKLLVRDLYGWNALGNPYTSAINATVSADATNNLITANTDNFDPSFAALYVWDAASSQYVTINNTGTGTLVQNYIQAGQGFFVRAKDNSGLNFSITEAMQTHQPAVPLKAGETAWPTIQLAASGNEKLSKTIVTFNQNMTTGLDVTYDAGMFKADKNFALYSKLVDDNGIDFAIQALPDNRFNELVIPLGIDVAAGTEITFSAEAMNLPAEAAVYLEDRAAGKITRLDVTNAKYYATITDLTKGAGNFFLHTNSATTAVSELENNLQVYTRDRAIYISGNLNTGDVITVYGVDGKLHYRENANRTGLLMINAAKMNAGIYLISIEQKTGRVTRKVVISE